MSGDVPIWLLNGASIAQGGSAGVIPPTSNWKIAGSGDFNADGKADVLWHNSVSGEVVVWLMNGTSIGSWGSVAVAGWKIEGVGDFNGDGKADILWRDAFSGDVVVWLISGTTLITYGSAGIIPPESGWQINGVGDFNGDGKADIVWRNTSTGEVSVWIMDGTSQASWGSPGTVSQESSWEIFGVGDINGDSEADLLWREFGTGEVVAWFMNGTTMTQYPTITFLPHE